MAAFRYAAADANGKESSGVLEADSARVARQLLRGRGLVPLSVEPVLSEQQKAGLSLSLGRRMSNTELAVVTRQLASLLGAALPVSDALTVMVEQSEKQQLRELMASIRTDVLGGTSLSAALARHPRQFPDIYRALIAAGQAAAEDHARVRLPGHRHLCGDGGRDRPLDLRGAAGGAGVCQHQAGAAVPDARDDRDVGFRS
jgi:general secretion pathway protein F